MELNAKEYYSDCEGPFYTDYLTNIQLDTPNAGIGIAKWDIKLTSLNKYKNELVTLFNQYYALKEISQETQERWQMLVQLRLDMVGETYDRAFLLYETNDVNELGKTNGTKYIGSSNNVENITTNNLNEFEDTPNNDLAGKQFLTDRRTITDNNKTIGDNKSNYDMQTRRVDEQTVEALNKNIKTWKNISNDFVEEFKNLFINSLSRV